MKWITANWGTVLVALTAVTSALNALLDHYRTAKPGVAKVLRAVLDVLSVLVPRNSPGTLKLPGVASKPPSAYKEALRAWKDETEAKEGTPNLSDCQKADI